MKLWTSALLGLVVLAACASSAPPAPPEAEAPQGPQPLVRPETVEPFAPPSANSMGWWNDQVFYLVFVRSFQDSNGDGVGDLKGLTSRLDYFVELGVNALWLMPIFESPSPHGYDAVDYYAIEQDYGTMADFEELVREAKKRNLRLVLDLVLNHTSNQHPFFLESQDPASPKRSWYMWSDRRERVGWHDIRGNPAAGWYYGQFGGHMPDLNYTNPDVEAEMFKVAKFWLDKGIDGYRLDAIKYLIEEGPRIENTEATIAWFQKFRSFIKGIKPDAYMIGEVWSPQSTTRRYVGGVDMTFAFDLASATISSINSGNKYQVEGVLNSTVENFPPNQFGAFLSNHDTDRVFTQLGESDLRTARLAAALLLTQPGVPYIYYGEELAQQGQRGRGGADDTARRRPMQWDDTPRTFGFTSGPRAYGRGFDQGGTERTVASLRPDPESIWNWYRSLIGLRRNKASLSRGFYLPVETNRDEVMAYLRYSPQQAPVLVLLNFSSQALDDYELALWSGPLSAAAKVTQLAGDPVTDLPLPDLNSTGGFDRYKPVERLAPRAVHILELSAR